MADPEVLTIGVRTGHPDFVNVSVDDPRSTNDFDLVVFAPNTVQRDKSRDVWREMPYFSEAQARPLAVTLERRRSEFDAFLRAGGDLILFAEPPEHFVFSPSNTPISGWDIVMTPSPFKSASGTKIEILDRSPIGDFLRSRAGEIHYRVSFETESDGWTPLVVAARTKDTVAAIWRSNEMAGRIILLPFMKHAFVSPAAPGLYVDNHEAAREFWDPLVKAVSDSRLVRSTVPSWAYGYAGPIEYDLRQRATDLEDQLAKTSEELTVLREQIEIAADSRPLLFASGSELEAAVAGFFEFLGGEKVQIAPNRADCVYDFGDWVAVIEVKGLTGSAKESNAAQLEKWASDFVDAGKAVKPVLVVNAFRDLSPDLRESAFPNQMLEYSTRRGHVLVESSQLYAAEQLLRSKSTQRSVFLSELQVTEGILDGYRVAAFDRRSVQ